uniref:Transmembrane protein n=1 Tax=Toxoplasma gondii (strain ATCC 50861 / VEG) TaxID=432359 RepID=A0A0F7V5F1_TOXGV|nr:TPA: hypothetical protein BN1205_017475 [Toxoplasma gondii VEG]
MSARFAFLGVLAGSVAAYSCFDSLRLTRDRAGFYFRSVAGANWSFVPHSVVYEQHMSMSKFLSSCGWNQLILGTYAKALDTLGYRF